MSKQFQFSMQIDRGLIDNNGHVNNLEYLKIGLDAGSRHWKNNTTKEQQAKYLWVVKRHEIDYLQQAFEGDELEVTTWIDNIEGATCHRHILIKNLSANKLVCKMITKWYLLNGITKKPLRIDEEIKIVFS
jgi:acyl-CoA thioester hydrolase